MLWGIQYLRAYAALIVLIFHAAILTKMPFAFGTGGVDVFFVVSGFLMWAITSDETKAGGFVLDRIKRIVPIYWIATVTVVAAELGGLTKLVEFDGLHLLASLFFVPNIAPWSDDIYPVLLVGWTLNYEMFFYFAFAATMALPRYHQPFALSAAFVALVLAGLMFPPASAFGQFYSNPIILEFVAGVWLGVAWEKGHIPARYGKHLLIAGGLGILAASVLDIPRPLAFGVPAVVLVLGVLILERQGQVHKNPLARGIGDASYSIYLWHLMFVTAIAGVLSGAAPLLAFIASIVFGIGGGLAGYLFIEEPIVQAFKRRRLALRPNIAG